MSKRLVRTKKEKLATLKLPKRVCLEMVRGLNLAVEHLAATAPPTERAAYAMEGADYVSARERLMVAMREAGMLDEPTAQASEGNDEETET